MTTTSYELSKKLKEFLGDSAPEPICNTYWQYPSETVVTIIGEPGFYSKKLPAYTIEDLLLKPFCEAMEKSSASSKGCLVWKYICFENLSRAYFEGGFPAVEQELLRLVGDK